MIAPRLINAGEDLAQRVIFHILPIDPDAFVIAQQVRRSVSAHPVTGGAQNRFQHGDTGAFAIGAADRNHDKRRRFRFQSPQDGSYPIQTEIDGFGMQGFLPVQPIVECGEAHVQKETGIRTW